MPPPRPPPALPAHGFNQIAMCRHGPMVFNRNDVYIGASLLKYGEFSAAESKVFRQIVRPGMMVIEVGANVGAHTLELSHLVEPGGAVVAFEPQRLVFQTLCANLALNSRSNVVAWQYAIGDRNGTIAVPPLDPSSVTNFGGLTLLGDRPGEMVPLCRLDDLGFEACHVLKIDVEGMEQEVLRGGAALIAKHRPVLYLEDDRPERSAGLRTLLGEWNYTVYHHRPPLFAPDNYAGDPENIFGAICSSNLACFPTEQGIEVILEP